MDFALNGKTLVITLQKGEDLRFSLNPCTDEAGDPVDFTGSTLTSQIRAKDGTLIATATASSPSTGRVDVVATDSADWEAQDAYIDVHETTSGGAQRFVLPRSILRITSSATVV